MDLRCHYVLLSLTSFLTELNLYVIPSRVMNEYNQETTYKKITSLDSDARDVLDEDCLFWISFSTNTRKVHSATNRAAVPGGNLFP